MREDNPEQRAAVKAIWSRALAGDEFTEVAQFGDSDLDRRFYEIKFNSLRDEDGRLIGAYQFVYDVTQRLRDAGMIKSPPNKLIAEATDWRFFSEVKRELKV